MTRWMLASLGAVVLFASPVAAQAEVRWGDQSWQEMLNAPMGVIVDRNVDPRTVVESGRFREGGIQ